MQAASEYQAAKAQIPQLEHQIRQQENALSILVGMNPRHIARQTRFAQVMPQRMPSLLPSQLLQRRPDIVQAQRQLLAADSSLASSQAKLLPSLNLTASGTLQTSVLHQLVDNPFRLWSVGGSVLAPLLNCEALTAQVDVSMATRNQALYAYEKWCATPSARSTTRSTLSNKPRAAAGSGKQQEIAADTLRIARNRYQNGYASYLDELDAQRTLFSAQLNVVQLKTLCCRRKSISIARSAAAGSRNGGRLPATGKGAPACRSSPQRRFPVKQVMLH